MIIFCSIKNFKVITMNSLISIQGLLTLPNKQHKAVLSLREKLLNWYSNSRAQRIRSSCWLLLMHK